MAQGIKILKPMPVTDAVLESSNVPEDDAPEWDADETYGVGANVMRAHAVYENNEPDNAGKDPLTNHGLWTRVRATNRWRLFDGTNSSATSRANAISYVLAPGVALGMVAALELRSCTSIRVRLIDPVRGVVYDKTLAPGARPVRSSWWQWYFGERTPGLNLAIFEGMPAYPKAKLHVDLVGGAKLSVGLLLWGQPRTWGLGLLQGAKVGRRIYSRREVNDFGDISLVKRPSAKTGSFETIIARSEVDALQNYLDSIDASLCLFVGSTMYASTVIFGIFQNAEMVLQYHNHSVLQLEILGAT
ncbi:hypothetical protein [Acidovorax sp. MR-S7]|uniref:hypothetical protein n=1 Tax=Acidovorax sp. MR-S7 TaxID=1268622 RepID=UPI00035FD3A4|nr:hypothetical protein [Acidovorax sp. MR-S7]GAD20966.1 hypothetical protein AVS7_00727 [Acidovorax sp. MR-S7]